MFLACSPCSSIQNKIISYVALAQVVGKVKFEEPFSENCNHLSFNFRIFLNEPT